VAVTELSVATGNDGFQVMISVQTVDGTASTSDAFYAFGVGCPKTGTHSLAYMLAKRFRSAHEPGCRDLIRLILAHHHQRLSLHDFTLAFKAYVSSLHLEMNSSQLNGFLIDALVAAHPHAQYILTVRDCRSWCRSLINHQIERPIRLDNPWVALREVRYGSRHQRYCEQDLPLEQHGLYSLDAYFSYWLAHNVRVLNAVPPNQLLIVSHRLNEEISELAGFLGISPADIDLSLAHSFPGTYADCLFDRLDQEYVSERAEHYTRTLLNSLNSQLTSRNAEKLIEVISRWRDVVTPLEKWTEIE
jgi:hypothetical protein